MVAMPQGEVSVVPPGVHLSGIYREKQKGLELTLAINNSSHLDQLVTANKTGGEKGHSP